MDFDGRTLLDRLFGADASENTLYRWSEERAQGLAIGPLLQKAQNVAHALRHRTERGDRVFLAMAPSAEFFCVFFGCQLAGLIPVSIAPNPGRRRAKQLAAMIDVADPALMICDTAPRQAADLHSVTATELFATDATFAARPAPGDIAYLQFTSGSTARPRAVVISHDAVSINVDCVAEKAGLAPGSKVLSWLPVHHDMGLVSSFFALAHGHDLIIEKPEQFSRAPKSWLDAISYHGAHFSGAPNFAYELLSRMPPDPGAVPQLDLSSWQVAFCGAEPIRPVALRRFAQTFASFGFRQDAYCPAYGMAELTLQATASGHGLPSRSRTFSTESGPRSVMSVGTPSVGHEIAIVDPDTRQRLPEGAEGEVWITGPSKGAAYWNAPEASAATFHARLADAPETGWLRSGDIGVMQDGELFVLGRIKNIVVLQGRNFHAEELETAAGGAHPYLSIGSVAAYAMAEGQDTGEGLGLICELRASRVEGSNVYPSVIEGIQRDLAQHCGVAAERITLVRRLSLPRTTSGKLRRAAAVVQLGNEALPVLYDWEKTAACAPTYSRGKAQSSGDILRWIQSWLHIHTGAAPGRDIANLPLHQMGLQSIAAVELAHDLEDWLRRPVSISTIFEAASFGDLARSLASEPDAPAPAAPARAAASSIFDLQLSELEKLSDHDVDLRLAKPTN